MRRLTEFVVGLIFGIGLIISGMTNPAKVIGFLDLAGLWDPSLAFVMGGAILVGVVAFAFAKRRAVSFFGDALHWPTSSAIDRRLIIGSLIFGAGWGSPAFAQDPPWCRSVPGCRRRSLSSPPCSLVWPSSKLLNDNARLDN